MLLKCLVHSRSHNIAHEIEAEAGNKNHASSRGHIQGCDLGQLVKLIEPHGCVHACLLWWKKLSDTDV